MEITLPAAEQAVGIATTLIAMQVLKKSFMANPKVVRVIRIIFFVSAAVQILIGLYIKRKISTTNTQKKFKYKPEGSILSTGEEPEQEVEITYVEYDNNEATKLLRSAVLTTIFYTVLGFKMNNNQIMISHAIGLLKNLFLSPLYRAYLYNMEVIRPFEKNLLFPAKAEKEEVVEKKKKKEE